jgi:hypothetical protein
VTALIHRRSRTGLAASEMGIRKTDVSSITDEYRIFSHAPPTIKAAAAAVASVETSADERMPAAPPVNSIEESVTASARVIQKRNSGANDVAPALPKWLEILAAIVAPSSLITALALYFGWVRMDAYFSYLGIDRSMLSFTTQDYLLRSTDVLLIPLGALLTGTVLVLRAHSVVRNHLYSHTRLLRHVTRPLIAMGAMLFLTGAVSAWQGLPFPTPFLFSQLTPGVGVALVAYGFHLRGVRSSGWSSTVTITMITFLVLLSLFSAASEYAAALGTGRAQQFAAGLLERPDVTVYSKDRLHIEALGVIETPLEGVDSAYRYRYRGLRSLLRNGGKYFLLPALWSHDEHITIILSETPSIRLQFDKGTTP